MICQTFVHIFADLKQFHSLYSPCTAVLHLHEALIAVGLVVVPAHRLVLVRADPAAPGEHELEVGQALGDGGHVHVSAAKMNY